MKTATARAVWQSTRLYLVTVTSCWIVLEGLVRLFPQVNLLVLAFASMVIVAVGCEVFHHAALLWRGLRRKRDSRALREM